MDELINVDEEVVWREKDKDARLNYSFDLKPLLADGDTLVDCSWSVYPSGSVITPSHSVDGTKAIVAIDGGTPGQWYAVVASWTSFAGVVDQFTVRIFVKQDDENQSPLGSALFPNRFTATQKMRRDRLLLTAVGVMPKVEISDDYIWDKLIAAEAAMQRRLRVKFQPTKYFPLQPSQEEIDALNGMPWELDPGYDYSADGFWGDAWGMFKLRNKPVISVDRLRFTYPAPAAGLFDVPADWIRVDAKAGTVQLVPSAVTVSVPLASLIAQAIAGGRTIPFMMQATYVAGLQNAATEWPDLVNLVMKQAVLDILGDAFLPSSGSISADGLSQTLSVDMEKYYDSIDRTIDGPKGANGGLMTAIHGIRVGVL